MARLPRGGLLIYTPQPLSLPFRRFDGCQDSVASLWPGPLHACFLSFSVLLFVRAAQASWWVLRHPTASLWPRTLFLAFALLVCCALGVRCDGVLSWAFVVPVRCACAGILGIVSVAADVGTGCAGIEKGAHCFFLHDAVLSGRSGKPLWRWYHFEDLNEQTSAEGTTSWVVTRPFQLLS